MQKHQVTQQHKFDYMHTLKQSYVSAIEFGIKKNIYKQRIQQVQLHMFSLTVLHSKMYTYYNFFFLLESSSYIQFHYLELFSPFFYKTKHAFCNQSCVRFNFSTCLMLGFRLELRVVCCFVQFMYTECSFNNSLFDSFFLSDGIEFIIIMA